MSEVTAGAAVLLFLAAVLTGGVNAIAGGGTLLTFPAFLAFGLPPLVATGSNAVALGHASAAFGARRQLFGEPLSRRQWALLCAIGLLGGAAGAMLLQAVGNAAFRKLIPVLIAMATLVFAAGPRLAGAASHRIASSSAWVASMLLVSVYVGSSGEAGV